MDDSDRRNKLNELRRKMIERRSKILIGGADVLGERYLQEWHPGISRDDFMRQLYESERDHSRDLIRRDVDTFADLHPVDGQRTHEAIKAWAANAGSHLDGQYGQDYYRIAVRITIAVYVDQMRAFRQRMSCEHGWHRTIERFIDACEGQPGFSFWSAREKWGVLSLSYACDPAVRATVREAERQAAEEASRKCEICGRPGKLRKFHWRKTLCDEHAVDRELALTDAEYERLQRHFSDGGDRWRPLIRDWLDEGLSADTIYQDFLQSFADLDADQQKFWAISCTRLVLVRRRRDAGRSKDDGI